LPPILEICALGGVTVAREGQPVHEQLAGKGIALLAWIAANRRPPELTCEQWVQYHAEPLCAEAGAAP
jgi:hypothetical protein